MREAANAVRDSGFSLHQKLMILKRLSVGGKLSILLDVLGHSHPWVN